MSKSISDPSVDRLNALIARHCAMPGPLLPLLHAVQDEFGYVPGEAVPRIAEALNLSRAEVHGVISFYHWFRQHPPGRHIVRICRAEACQSMNGVATEEAARRLLGLDWHGTTADGQFTLEAVYCLGNCAASPAAMIDGKLYGRVTPGKLEQLLAQHRVTP